MLYLILLGGAALLFVVSAKKTAQAEVEGPPNPPPPGASGGPSDPSKAIAGAAGAVTAIGAKLGLGGAASTAGVVAAGAVLTVAAGEFGQRLTGTTAGRLAGYANWYSGTAVNLGTQAGKEADKALGGDGKGPTGIIAQGGAGAFTGALTVANGIFSIAIAQFTVVAYLVGSAISDIARLSYGQAGAKADYEKKWAEAFDAFRFKMQASGSFDYTGADTVIHRYLYPFIDGYMKRLNRQAFLMWMRKPRGIGVTGARGHAQWGMDRGYFVGNIGPDGELSDNIPNKSDSPHALEYVPANELTAFTGPRMVRKNIFTARACRTVNDGPLFMDEFPAGINPVGLDGNPQCGDWVDEIVQDGETTWYADSKKADYFKQGDTVCNFALYAAFMAEPHGAFQDDAHHAQYGLNEQRFEGTVDDTGALAFEGERIYYKDIAS